MPEWTLITKHAVVLSIMADNPRITALEIAGQIGVTERATRKIIAELYENGYIDKKREEKKREERRSLPNSRQRQLPFLLSCSQISQFK